MNHHIRYPLLTACLFMLSWAFLSLSQRSLAGVLPADVLSQLNSYNEVWSSPSANGSPGSMPIGNGDITANVWVTSNDDLMMYIGKSDCWSEGTRLLKLGRTRIHFSPNPFANGAPFSQTLNFHKGEIDIQAGPPNAQISIRIWIDANNPVIHVETSGTQPFVMTCSNEVWRSSPYTMNGSDGAAGSFRGVSGGPQPPSESADQVLSLSDRLVWYHRNTANSFYNAILAGENLSGFQTNYPDVYANLTFGATIKAANFSKLNDYTLQSPAGTNFTASIYAYTAQTPAATDWQQQMSDVVALVDATDIETARTNHCNWWDAFWNRSWIFISGDANATLVTRGYLQQRFMEACQGRGKYPMKFNGGTLTFDYNGQNADYRQWGPGYWHQNTRHLYWPLLASGDFDLMQPWFGAYMNMLNLEKDWTNKLFGHGGAFFPETFNFFGLYELDDWGWGRPNETDPANNYIRYHYQGGLETLAMMLTYYDYTQDSAFATNSLIPFATQVIRFFDQHWQRVNGKIVFGPANALETYQGCTNPTDVISGLLSDIPRLLALPAAFTTPALIQEWTNCYAALPPLPMDATGSYVKPAQIYDPPGNTENPECYCLFPYRLYGLGKSNFDIALATFYNRVFPNQKSCWGQDVIQEPLVGLTAAAQADVIGNFGQTDGQCRFQGFWTTHNDYLPDLDNGGAAMTGLQFMLLQCNGNQINLLPAWPAGWNVDFKLCAPGNTTVRLKLQSGAPTQVTVSPAARTNDVVIPEPAGLSAVPGNAQATLLWRSSTSILTTYNIKRATVSGGPYTPVATGIATLTYKDTGLANGTHYYYVVSGVGLLGESPDSAEVSVVPSQILPPIRVKGDLVVNLQSADLNAGSGVWTNRTASTNSVGNFTAVGGGNLNVANLTWNSQTIKTLFVNSVGNNAVWSALATPTEINAASPVSVEVWVYPIGVVPPSHALAYGLPNVGQTRMFAYDTGSFGAFSGYYDDLAWSTPATAGAWKHLVWTYDGSTMKAYVNGYLDASTSLTLNTTQTKLIVGANFGSTSGNSLSCPFQGHIACARVESGLLTDADILVNFVLGPLTSVLPAPTGLSASPNNNQVVLNWTASSGATGYKVKRAPASGGPYSVISSPSGPPYTDTTGTNGTTYYYVVSATSATDESADSAEASATIHIIGTGVTTTTLARHSGTGSSSTYGDSLSFDVTVSGASTPTGTVTLKDGGAAGTTLGSATLTNGACTLTATALTTGTHNNLVAVYAGDSNFASSASSALSPAQSVNPATPVVTVNVGSYTYNGSAQGPYTATTDPVSTGTVTFRYAGVSGTTYPASATPPTNVGSYTCTAAVAADSNCLSASSSATPFAIARATPVITWDTPAPIIVGSALGASQLNATSGGVSGNFVYTPASGAVLAEGSHSLSVQFTPTLTANYNTPAATTVTLLVRPAGSSNIIAGWYVTGTRTWTSTSWYDGTTTTFHDTGGNGMISVTGQFTVGLGSPGTLNQTGGTITCLSASEGTIMGQVASGTYNMSGYATYIDNVGPYTIFGNLTGGGDVATWSLSDHASVTIGSQGLSIGWPGGTAGSRHLLLSGAASFTTASLTFNATGGDANYISFATGSTATLTVTGTHDYAALVTNGNIRVDGVAATMSQFQVVGNTLSLGGGANPYDTWGNGSFANTFTDKNPTHDPDGDGMTNFAEFAFGLDPTTGASANPISQPFDKATGKFRYTRTATSGLIYTVWTSGNLQDWTEDVTASNGQTDQGTVGGIQTVEVTITAPSPVGGKLFVRVQAE